MKRTTSYLTLIIIATFIALGCTQQPARTPVVLSAPPLATLASVGVQTATAQSKALHGKVVSIADGDTLTVLESDHTQRRIRLTGIDAPESRQAFGTRSRQHLADLVFGKQITVEYDKNDRYGRTLGKVLINGRDINLEMVIAGLAWHYKYYEREQPPADRTSYAQAEMEARAAKRGLWTDPNPIPPWDFRRGRRDTSTGQASGDTEPPIERTTPPSPPRSGAPSSTTGAPRMPAREPETETVFITRTGAKYHRATCQYLRRSQIPISLKDAKLRYTPCSICRPLP